MCQWVTWEEAGRDLLGRWEQGFSFSGPPALLKNFCRCWGHRLAVKGALCKGTRHRAGKMTQQLPRCRRASLRAWGSRKHRGTGHQWAYAL